MTTTTPAAASAASAEAVGAVYRNVTRTPLFTILATWAVVHIVRGSVPDAALLAWALAVSAISLGRLVHVAVRVRSRDFLAAPARDARDLIAGLLLTGVVLASGFVLFALRVPLLEQYAIALFVVALTAGAATALTGCRAAFAAYSAPILLAVVVPLLAVAALSGDGQRGFLGLMMLIYSAGLFVFQKKLDAHVVENIALRMDKEALLAEKDLLLGQLRAHNAELSADREAFLTASLTDGLTGLANRRHFDRTLARDWERNRREGEPLACIMLDIDHFKHFNDLHGHQAGDDCLRAIADIIAANVSRGGDFAARYGGEEFVVLLPGTGAHGARLIAERVRAAVEERAIPHRGARTARVVTLSAGVAALTPSAAYTSAQTLVDLADEALYEAKSRGRNRVVTRAGGDGDAQGTLTPSAG